MESNVKDDFLEWEGLYPRLASINNTNTSAWFTWNVTEPNSTWWDTTEAFESSAALLRAAIKAILLGLLILATVVGNVFVIAAILLERHLRSAANHLILSLAVADLLVACLVMPLGAVYEVAQRWTLGPELCDMWTSGDVLCCTASILHLVAIALDRYWAVTNIDYIHARTAKRISYMIACVWIASFLVCIAPLLGWKDPDWTRRVSEDLRCVVSQDVGYQIFATMSSFYVPVLVILILYWRIYQTARKRIRRRPGTTSRGMGPPPVPAGGALVAAGGSGGIAAAVVAVIGRPLPTISETTTTGMTTVSSNNTSPEKQSCANGLEADPPTTGYGAVAAAYYPTLVRRKPKEAADSKRERKAAKTLAIITGAFVACWLPFFVLAILVPTCDCEVSPVLTSLSLWLGYFNSTLNPVIYTVFSPEFRHAFQRLLCGRRGRRRRAPP
ncbi:5-hydroxytryptamine receptor-like [Leptidea sinapis]|uniref:5-hydroxytryptamine receptor-like n=1 Tax=Leptidea sinapis TaxID=189913 RepID=UPI00212D5F99|nr:5-hydroxytryptamine receptor-like [Leptidea sinapis]